MAYVQLSSTCFSEAIGTHGLDRTRYEIILAKTKSAIDFLRSGQADDSLPFLFYSEANDDFEHLWDVVSSYQENFDDVVILGTGGSSLGGRTLVSIADSQINGHRKKPKLHFFDNIDPHSLDNLLNFLIAPRTGFLVISKSGETAETMVQFLICFQAAKEKFGDKAHEHFTVIVQPGKSVMRQRAEALDIPIFDHHPKIGGRYSAFSLVGLLPAMIAGLNPETIRKGAAEVLMPILDCASPEFIEPAIGAAISFALATENQVKTTVLMSYSDRLESFGLWFRQLWAESLGKKGKGTTPVNALGAVDQHSQLQLYLDGPRDKMFTLILLACAEKGPRVASSWAKDKALTYLANKTVGDLMEAEQNATAKTLIKNFRPTRIFRLSTLDEYSLGGLMMHFMLETIIAAHLFEINPFDQPAVEEGKVLARKFLTDGGG